jgi:hypothetical protein
MVPLLSLWLPILLSAVLVFFVSFILHTVLTYHRSDFGKLPREDDVMDALRPFAIPPGEYAVPCAGSMKEMSTPAFLEKRKRGPVAFLTVLPSGPYSMSKSLAQWFVYSLVVSVFAAYVAGRALGPGADYLDVFRFAGSTAFVGYALALWQSTIWYKRPWSTNAKLTFDGLVYAGMTAGTFGWLWPR